MTTLETFRLLASEFANVDDAVVEQYIVLAELRISESKFGQLYTQALALLAAHMLKGSEVNSSGGSSGTGAVKSEKTGDLQVEYGVQSKMSAGDLEYSKTAYGTQYLALRRQVIVGATVGACCYG